MVGAQQVIGAVNRSSPPAQQGEVEQALAMSAAGGANTASSNANARARFIIDADVESGLICSQSVMVSGLDIGRFFQKRCVG